MSRERERESKQGLDWTGNQRSIYTTLGASNHTDKERQQHDYYATEPKAMELLLAEEDFSPVIWECACGEGHLSKVLEEHGFEVISTDLIYRGFGDPEPLDFLKDTLEDFEGDIITNPPYGERIEEKKNLPALYKTIGERFKALDSWSMYLITAYEDAERYIGRKADKNRKIYNGMMKTYYYQFMGPKPPRRKTGDQVEA